MTTSMTTLIPQYFPSKGSNNNHFKTVEEENMPNDYFRLWIVGPIGSRKTNLLMHLLFRPLIYYKIILYAKNLEQHYYRVMVERFEKMAEKLVDTEDLLQVSNQEVEDIEAVPHDKQKIVIFDDYICSQQDQCSIAKYFISHSEQQKIRESVVQIEETKNSNAEKI